METTTQKKKTQKAHQTSQKFLRAVSKQVKQNICARTLRNCIIYTRAARFHENRSQKTKTGSANGGDDGSSQMDTAYIAMVIVVVLVIVVVTDDDA